MVGCSFHQKDKIAKVTGNYCLVVVEVLVAAMMELGVVVLEEVGGQVERWYIEFLMAKL